MSGCSFFQCNVCEIHPGCCLQEKLSFLFPRFAIVCLSQCSSPSLCVCAASSWGRLSSGFVQRRQWCELSHSCLSVSSGAQRPQPPTSSARAGLSVVWLDAETQFPKLLSQFTLPPATSGSPNRSTLYGHSTLWFFSFSLPGVVRASQ